MISADEGLLGEKNVPLNYPVTSRFSFESKEKAMKGLGGGRLERLTVPSVSRLWLENVQTHFNLVPLMIVINQRITNTELTNALDRIARSLDFLCHFVYIDVREHPRKARDVFGFSLPVAGREYDAEFVLYAGNHVGRRGRTKKFGGNPFEKAEWTKFIVLSG